MDNIKVSKYFRDKGEAEGFLETFGQADWFIERRKRLWIVMRPLDNNELFLNNNQQEVVYRQAFKQNP